MNLLTIVYGDKHVNLFKDTCIKSLAQEKNRIHLEEMGSTWHVYTDQRHIETITGWIKEHFPKITPRVQDRSEARRYIDESQGMFIRAIEQSLKDDQRVFFCPPDIIFGEGSVNGLIKSSKDPASVAVVAHVRVTPSILEDTSFKSLINSSQLTNPQLVSLAWKHLHRCWTDAEVGHPRQNQWGTGVSWQEIEPNLYSITHRLPTPYMMRFTPEDLQHAKTWAGFGNFDHTWPGDILLKRGRQRYVSSSDVAFMVEITEPHKNISNLVPGQNDPNDFWAKHFHNEINKQYLITFRGEQ